ncbi:hypothetical protein DL93DRAFT_2232557 [Clavulina sp. PMI_390]|nr:hypothetical protein DL93DRAFT_2232557 [Clavulina sp. PMI_390]
MFGPIIPVPQRHSILARLPIEILITILENLDVPSSIRLSMASGMLYELVNSRGGALTLALARLREENIPRNAFSLSSMEPKALMNLATRCHRLVWNVDHLPIHDRALAPNRRFDLAFSAPPTRNGQVDLAVLPGGRWVIAIIGSGNMWNLLCYDLQPKTSISGGLCDPIITIPLEWNAKGKDKLRIRRFEFCQKDSTFNVVLDCTEIIESTRRTYYWPALIRLQIEPVTDVLTYSSVPFPSMDHMDMRLHHLSGDFISFQDASDPSHCQAIVWNWRTNSISDPVEAGQFVLTRQGSIISLKTPLLTRRSSVCEVMFSTWVHAETRSPDPNSAISSARLTLAHSHQLRFNIFEEGHQARLRLAQPTLGKWAESDEEILISMSMCYDRWTRYILVAVDKNTFIPRVISLKSALTTNASKSGISAAQAFFLNWVHTTSRRWSCLIMTKSALADPDIPFDMITIQFPSFPNVALAIMKNNANVSWGLLYHSPFCPRSGQLVVPLGGQRRVPEDWAGDNRISFRAIAIQLE